MAATLPPEQAAAAGQATKDHAPAGGQPCKQASVEFPSKLRVLELFAGIGGWRLALEAAIAPTGCKAEVSAYDSGPHCSEVYQNNFGDRCSRRNIEQLDADALEDFDVWVMSPPCQPFSTTREAKQRDIEDSRCKALDHLCKTIPKLQRPPRWLALENVKGFHGSEASVKFQAALQEAGFTFWPLLLDLEQFGVPNHRTRYYLLAERSSRFASSSGTAASSTAPIRSRGSNGPLPHGGILVRGGDWACRIRREIEEAHREARTAGSVTLREEAFSKLRSRFAAELREAGEAGSVLHGLGEDTAAWKLLPLPRAAQDAFVVMLEDSARAAAVLSDAAKASIGGATWSLAEVDVGDSLPRCINEFLEEHDKLPEGQRQELLVSRETLAKPFARSLSYVEPESRQSFCFTGHYGKVLHKSSGSLLHMRTAGQPYLDREDPTSAFGSVRFFSPKEIINLLGFPASYRLPPEMALRHRYKVVGNSIAVIVATELLEVLLLGKDSSRLRLLQQDIATS